MVYRVAVLGSCTSEDWIHHLDPRSRPELEFFPVRQHSAIVSQFSKKHEIPSELGSRLSKWESQQITWDLDKSFLERVTVAKPSHLLVDLVLDARVGCRSYNGGWITSGYMLAKSSLFEGNDVKGWITWGYLLARSSLFEGNDSKGVLSPLISPKKYFRLFQSSLTKLRIFLDENLPDCQVILHKSRFATEYLDKNGKVRPFNKIIRMVHQRSNKTLEALEKMFEDEVDCLILDLTDEPIRADEQHIWGLAGGLHYERNYYIRFCAAVGNLLPIAKHANLPGS
jgi:uncharacterized protein DUF6270